jgi:hypothetical protein
MNYPIPVNSPQVAPLPPPSGNEELLAVAIAGVVEAARSQGQSLEEVLAEVLAEDTLLEGHQRRWLGEIVAQAWVSLP